MGTVRRAIAMVLVAGAFTVGAGAIGASSIGAVMQTKSVSEGRLQNVDYQVGLLETTDAKRFASAGDFTPSVQVIGPAGWTPKVCDHALVQSDTEIAGRSVQYDPTNEASIANFVAAFDSASSATAFVGSAKTFGAGCDEPYLIGSATYTAGPALKVPQVDDQQVGLSGTFEFSNGQTANNAQIFVRGGQLVEYVNMISVATITPKIVSSVTKAMGKRLDALQDEVKATEKRTTKKSKNASCDRVITKAQLEKVFGVPLQAPDDCGYALATGAGGIDVGFTTAAKGADFVYARIAKGVPTLVKGTSDAIYSRSTNQFGQLSETIYVKLRNGDMFTIGLRGDDAPKNQKDQLKAAAKTAAKNT